MRLLLVLILLLSTMQPSVGSAASTQPGDGASTSSGAKDDQHLFRPIIWGEQQENRLQVGGEVRARAEYRKNFDLNDSRKRGDDGLGFLRTRVNFELLHGDLVRAFVELMDAREIGAEREQGQEAFVDLQQAFLDLKPTAKGPWTLRLGRQEIDLGRDKRLSEASGWNNLRRRYDGARALYHTDDLDVSLFAVNPNYNEQRRGDDIVTRRGRRRDEELFYGAYLTSRHFAPHTLETYFLGLSDSEEHRTFAPDRKSEDGTYGSSNRYTIGSVLYGPLRETDNGTLSYTAEGAGQFGRYSKDRIRSFFLRGDLTYEWKRTWKPTLGLVGTWASGDKDPDDGVAGRFDPLFGTNHTPYGIMDFVRARNLREVALVGAISPTKKLTFRAEAHSFWMDSKTDSWSNAPGEPALRDKSGGSGTELGQEISLTTEYAYSKRLTLEAGATRFFSGTFPEANGRSGSATFLFLQTRYRF